MLTIHTLVLGDYQTNCYLLCHSDRCVIVDPGCQPELVLDALKQKNLTADAILLTHGHFDHVGGVKTIAAELECPVYIHPQECSLPPMLTAGKLYYTHTYDEGDILSLAGLSIRVLHTPGHTPGSVCLICDGTMLSGDTLFAGTCGRTDLPGGSWATIQNSLRRLAQLEADLTVLPGHGETTTLASEKKYNPYMR